MQVLIVTDAPLAGFLTLTLTALLGTPATALGKCGGFALRVTASGVHDRLTCGVFPLYGMVSDSFTLVPGVAGEHITSNEQCPFGGKLGLFEQVSWIATAPRVPALAATPSIANGAGGTMLPITALALPLLVSVTLMSLLFALAFTFPNFNASGPAANTVVAVAVGVAVAVTPTLAVAVGVAVAVAVDVAVAVGVAVGVAVRVAVAVAVGVGVAVLVAVAVGVAV